MNQSIEKIIEILESKQRDCVAFSKKHKTRGDVELYQYYEGAGWAFEFAISCVKEELK